MKVYVNQTNLTLTLNAGMNLTSVSSALIKYIKPDLTRGSWTATADGLNVIYNINNGDLDQSGKWIVWAEVTFTNNKISIGESNYLQIYNVGE